jgi:hypothetical protein
MTPALFEQLLHEEESESLDFKQGQYPFARASEEEKSEILKDILGFANAFRRADAYILLGVEEVRGVGAQSSACPNISMTIRCNSSWAISRAVLCALATKRFRSRESRSASSRSIGSGRLEKDRVYVRRGSSTDPTRRPAQTKLPSWGFPSSSKATFPNSLSSSLRPNATARWGTL